MQWVPCDTTWKSCFDIAANPYVMCMGPWVIHDNVRNLEKGIQISLISRSEIGSTTDQMTTRIVKYDSWKLLMQEFYLLIHNITDLKFCTFWKVDSS